MPRTAARVLVDCLLAQGVTTAFGVPGESYLAVLDALHDVPDRIRMIANRQEGGAAFMAAAWGKLTGRPGICFVTRGPGATNAAIGVHTARQDSSPMILFVGQIGDAPCAIARLSRRSTTAPSSAPLAKWAVEIDDPDRMPELVARAFAVARTGRPGPVVVALPEDMLSRRDRGRGRPAGVDAQGRPRGRGPGRDRPPARGRRGAAGARGRRRLGRGRAGGRCAPSPRRTACRWSWASATRISSTSASPSYAGDGGLAKTAGVRAPPRRGRRHPRGRPPLRRDPDRRLHALRHPADGRDADPRPRLGRRAQQDRDRDAAGARASRPADAGARRAAASPARDRWARAHRRRARRLAGEPRHAAAARRARHGRGGPPPAGDAAGRRDPDQRRRQLRHLDQQALRLRRGPAPPRPAVGRDGLRRSRRHRGEDRPSRAHRRRRRRRRRLPDDPARSSAARCRPTPGRSSSSSTTAATAPSACTRSAAIPRRVSFTDIENPDFVALAAAYGTHAERVARAPPTSPPPSPARWRARRGAVLELVIDIESLTPRQTLSAMRAAALKR